MYRFLLAPKWIAFHLAVIATIVAMILLANWQWTKYGARNDFVDTVHAREDAPPRELVPLLSSGALPADIEYSRVTAAGSYLRDQLVQINVTQGGANGVNVLTPFQVEGGPIVLVNRGFVPDGTDVPAPPDDHVIVGGTARTSQARRTGELTDNQSGSSNEVRRVDLPLISSRLSLTLAPVYIDLI